jgi:uncharacterized repeat protein (TIGR03803 family)
MRNRPISQWSRTGCLADYFVALPLLLCLAAPTGVHAQTLTTLASFNGTNGAFPSTQLVKTHRWFQHSNGNFYGTTPFGGAHNYGTVFQVTPASAGGVLTAIYSFCSTGGSACTDGDTPQAALIEGSNGNLYGTTFYGGANNAGTVFEITTSGTLTTLYSFCSKGGSACTDGANPLGALALGSNGNFYGTTYAGGASNDGTVFEINCSGTVTTLHSFSGTDGVNPQGDLLQLNGNGNFFGATLAGGNSTGSGTLFEITPGGALSTLYNFCSKTNCTDGSTPRAPFTQDNWGNIYGTTTYTGANAGGTVFQFTNFNVLHTLYHFCSKGGSACTDGEYPVAGPVLGIDGNIYGTTSGGGANGYGTIYQLTPWSVLNTLYNFCSKGGSACTDGANPEASLVQGTDQNFYGTTAFGGTYGLGTAFDLNTIPPGGGQCNGVYSGQYWGNITVASGQSCEFTDGGQIWGNVYVTGGNLILNNASVMGNVNIEGGGTYTLGPSLTIMSTLDIENLPSSSAQNTICGVTVNGGLQFDGNGTGAQIGSSSGSCAGNSIGGDLEVLSNTAPVQTFNNTVGNNLVCTGNSSVAGGGNKAVQKQSQCSSF